jgi:hypothetical protein
MAAKVLDEIVEPCPIILALYGGVGSLSGCTRMARCDPLLTAEVARAALQSPGRWHLVKSPSREYDRYTLEWLDFGSIAAYLINDR